MNFLKTNLVSLISATVAVLALVVAAIGMTSNAVQTEMKSRLSRTGEIQTLKNNAKNQAMIDAETARGERAKQEYSAALKAVEKINEHKPLLDGVFPKPTSQAIPFEFREAYRKAIVDLPKALRVTDTPTDADIALATEQIKEINEIRKTNEGEGGKTQPPIGERDRDGGTPPPPTPAPAPSASGDVPSGDPMMNPKTRAMYNKANAARMYMSTEFNRQVLHLSSILSSTEPPTPAQMWYAQVGLWIQTDLMNAIKQVNDAAAAAAPPGVQGINASAVKRLEKIRIHGYRLTDKVVDFYGVSAADVIVPSFTGRVGDTDFDVVRLTMTLVVDQRYLPQIVDAICHQNLYTLIAADYTVAKEDFSLGYVYGANPAVRAVLHFEGYMARSIYAPLMPQEVKTALGIQ